MIQLQPAHVKAIVQRQFPELSPSDVTCLGEGCDSWAFEVDGQWVFRFPKRADVEERLATETRIVPRLAEQSSLPLPEFCFHGRRSDAFPWSFVGYRKIPGVPAMQIDARTLPFDAWVPAVGRFLSWLHRFPVDEAMRLGVQEQDVTDLIEEVRTDALDDFELLSRVAESAPVDRWHSFFEAACPPSPHAASPVLVHRDLAAEHVLWDPARQEVTGIIDWSDIAISDRSVDLACFFHCGGRPCMAAALTAYDGPVDDSVLERARFLAACRGVADVAFGLEAQRPEYIQAGLRALTLCLGADES